MKQTILILLLLLSLSFNKNEHKPFLVSVEKIRATQQSDLDAIFETTADMMVVIDRAITIINGTVPLPANPIDGQVFMVTSRTQITNLTLSSNGRTVYGAPSSLSVNSMVGWVWDLASNAWFPYGNPVRGYTLQVQALTSSPADAQTIFFGNLPKAPTTTAATSKIFIRQAGIIKRAEIYCFSGTAGTNEAWPVSIRVNNTTDTQIASLSVSTSERVFSNTALSITVAAGDFIEIKAVNPTWATNPLTCIFGGYIYIE